jgi:hypothetical protein
MTHTPRRFHRRLKPSRHADIKTAEAVRMAESLLHRARGEFLEMPGLRLTPAEAARLWAVDAHTSKQILDGLEQVGFLLKNRNGAYLRASGA